ncbi:conserved hypothetical protein, secreted, partial [Candidatus Magnetomorum sp. HK-1]
MKQLIPTYRFILKKWIFVLILGLCLNAYPVFAAISTNINSQGVLSQSDGSALTDGMYEMKFSIWNCDSYTNTSCQLWEEEYANGDGNAISITEGYYNVYLGSIVPFPYTLTFDVPYYLGIK